MYLMPGILGFEKIAIWAVFGVAILGLLYANFLRNQILKEDMGTEKMQEVWGAIKDGADAYLRKQLRSILPLIVILTAALFLSVYIVPPSPEALERFSGSTPDQVRLIIGVARALAFVMGALFSLTVGQIGMRMAIQGNVRVASASRRSFGDSLRIAYRAGTITGMLTDGLGLLGGTVIFIVLGIAAPDALLGFGFGGTLLALFMRVGGGIFTKAADVGADLVGKVEAGIPEDDPRNPAVVADLVGDNVGDCAGMAADIFESYEVTMVSGLILGLALWHLTGRLEWIIFPLIVRGIGVLSSIVGTYAVRGGPGKGGDAMAAIFRGFLSSAAISAAALLHCRLPVPAGPGTGRLVAYPRRGRRWRAAGHRDRSADGVLHRDARFAGTQHQEGCRHRPGHPDPAGRFGRVSSRRSGRSWSSLSRSSASILIFGAIPGVDRCRSR